jgi:hypothetical protein
MLAYQVACSKNVLIFVKSFTKKEKTRASWLVTSSTIESTSWSFSTTKVSTSIPPITFSIGWTGTSMVIFLLPNQYIV